MQVSWNVHTWNCDVWGTILIVAGIIMNILRYLIKLQYKELWISMNSYGGNGSVQMNTEQKAVVDNSTYTDMKFYV